MPYRGVPSGTLRHALFARELRSLVRTGASVPDIQARCPELCASEQVRRFSAALRAMPAAAVYAGLTDTAQAHRRVGDDPTAGLIELGFAIGSPSALRGTAGFMERQRRILRIEGIDVTEGPELQTGASTTTPTGHTARSGCSPRPSTPTSGQPSTNPNSHSNRTTH